MFRSVGTTTVPDGTTRCHRWHRLRRRHRRPAAKLPHRDHDRRTGRWPLVHAQRAPLRLTTPDDGNGLGSGLVRNFFGEVSHSIQTASIVGRTLCDTGGRCRGGWQCHTLGNPGIMPRKEMSRREGAVSLGNTHRLRRPASIISLIWLPAVPRAGLKRWPGLGKAPARRACRRGISSTAMFGLSTTIRVETNQ